MNMDILRKLQNVTIVVEVKLMSIFLFAIIHILVGLALIYFYGKLPKALTVFVSVLLIMGFLYLVTYRQE